MAGRTERRLRMVALLLAFLVFGTAAMLRLGYWQVVAAPDLVLRAVDTMAPPPEPKLARGEISTALVTWPVGQLHRLT
jgi:hypothetical protein